MKELIEPEVDEHSVVTLQKITADNFRKFAYSAIRSAKHNAVW